MKQKYLTNENQLTAGGYRNRVNSLDYMSNTATINQSRSQGVFGRIGTGLVGGVATLTDGIANIIGVKKSLDNDSEAIQADKAAAIEATSSSGSVMITIACCAALALVVFIIYKKKGA